MIDRLLVLAPTPRDAQISGEILSNAGLVAHTCGSMAELCQEIQAGAGAVLLTDSTLSTSDPDCLASVLADQPAWSDMPVLLLSPLGAESPTAVWAMNALSNLTVLDQPVRVMTLVSALRTAVKARGRQYELRDRLEALRQADRQKDEFLATLSHELRNPLAPIRNALHIMRLAGTDAETRARVLDTMERQVANVTRLVDDLLELSRINQGRIPLRTQRIKLSGVIRTALESSGPLIEAAGLHLQVNEPTEPILIVGDPVRLTQVLANLLNNAAKYTPAGGSIWLDVARDGQDAIITVRDTGQGIPPEMLTRIFEMFVQVDPDAARTRQNVGSVGGAGGGLGIGLTLVKRLVEMHKGQVEARSEGPGKGSEFVVRLPILVDQRSPSADRGTAPLPERDRRKAELPSRRILVVDDHHDSADSLATLLRLLGHEVRVAYDGAAGLEVAGHFHPNVGLLDIAMPGMNGHDLARRLRQEPSGDRLLLVAMTGFGRDEDLRQSREAGFDGHLVKPVDLAALNTLLTSHEEGPRRRVADVKAT